MGPTRRLLFSFVGSCKMIACDRSWLHLPQGRDLPTPNQLLPPGCHIVTHGCNAQQTHPVIGLQLMDTERVQLA